MARESPYLTVQRILQEPSNTYDDLRIIASSATRLDGPTRALIRSAADELEQAQKALIDMQAKLIEAQSRAIALHDRLATILPIHVARTCRPMICEMLIEGWRTYDR